MSELKIAKHMPANNVKAPATDVIKEAKITEKTAKQEQTSTTKVVMSGLAAAAVIGAAILAVKKGCAAKAFKTVNLNQFKEAGNKFVKGKAFTKSGKPFTGVITTTAKNGMIRKMEYVNGELKEVKSFMLKKAFNGETCALPVGKKTYNYAVDGKLESVDKFSWGHLSSKDPKQHGFQYIKQGSTNLDEKRAEGLKNFAQKQSEKINKPSDLPKLSTRTPEMEKFYEPFEEAAKRGEIPSSVLKKAKRDGDYLRYVQEDGTEISYKINSAGGLREVVKFQGSVNIEYKETVPKVKTYLGECTNICREKNSNYDILSFEYKGNKYRLHSTPSVKSSSPYGSDEISKNGVPLIPFDEILNSPQKLKEMTEETIKIRKIGDVLMKQLEQFYCI